MSDTSARQVFVRRQAQSIRQRRETLARNMAELQADIDHWNRTHPNEEPIVLSADLTPDIEAVRNGEREIAEGKTVTYEV